jgi:hypothetical protein
MGVVVTNENVNQIVQTIYENAHNNTKRLNDLDPIINKMSVQVNRLDTLLVDNGYAQSVKDAAKEIKKLRQEFNHYVMDRENSCPVSKRLERDKNDANSRKNWTGMVLRIIFAGIGAVSTIIILAQTLKSLIGG